MGKQVQWTIAPAHLQRIVAQAIKDGRHSENWPGTVCDGCGEWRRMWWGNEQGRSFCRECSPKDKQ